MAKSETGLSDYTRITLADTSNLLGRSGDYMYMAEAYNVKRGKNEEVSLEDKRRGIVDAIFSATNMGMEHFRINLTYEQKKEFAENLKTASDQMKETLVNLSNKDHVTLLSAKTEANLKGFSLPLTSADIEDYELNGTGLTREQHTIAVNAHNKAIISLNNRKPQVSNTEEVPQAYSQALTQEINKFLIESGVKENELKLYESYLNKGVIDPAKNPYTGLESEKRTVNDVVVKTAKQFTTLLQNSDTDYVSQTIITARLKVKLIKATTLNDSEKEKLSQKLESVKELWKFAPENMVYKKVKYLDSPGELRDLKAADQAFSQILHDLAKASPPSQLKDLKPEILAASHPDVAARAVVGKFIDKLEADNKYKLTPELKEQIALKLTPGLSSLGSAHLAAHPDSLVADMYTKLDSNRSLFSRMRGKFEVTDTKLDKIAIQVIKEQMPQVGKEQMPQVEKASFLKLQDQMMKHATKTEDFNKGVKAFAESQGVKEDLSKAPLEDIAKLRLKNPKAFDEAVFPQKAKDSPMVAEVMNSPEAIKARAQFASSKTSSVSRTDDAAKMSAFKENQQAGQTLPLSRPAPLTLPELEKQSQENQLKTSSKKPGTIGRAGGKNILEVFGEPLKENDARPLPTPPARPSASASLNKGRNEGRS